ncbi:unnamed protein product [Camellia sinensis]
MRSIIYVMRSTLKWWWRFGNEDKVLWKKIVCGKYNLQGSRWCPLVKRSDAHSRIWKDTLSVGSLRPELYNLFFFFL